MFFKERLSRINPVGIAVCIIGLVMVDHRSEPQNENTPSGFYRMARRAFG